MAAPLWEIVLVKDGLYQVLFNGTQMFPGDVRMEFAREFIRRARRTSHRVRVVEGTYVKWITTELRPSRARRRVSSPGRTPR